ncbi:MAG: ABC transporter substrate-binding protein [Ruminococcaceae bacterium]|jgi:peptide/nickel transport system substrate-binding protein|nr:ABC transporter substrate-binding protein [Oscillospiraceae bacterium]
MKRILAIVLALVLVVCAFAGCSGKKGNTEVESDNVKVDELPEPNNSKPLVVGYSNFSSKFSPFFSETAYDQDVYKMTSVYLLNIDRQGAVVEKGKTGEVREYNGHNYEYKGPADLTITENKDGTVDYDFDLRDDITFSDGEKLTADDVIFSMYVLADPTYDGSSTLYSLPIEGMEEYRSGMATKLSLMYTAGRDNKDFKYWTEKEQKDFWAKLDKAGTAFAQEIIDYCKSAGLGDTAYAAAEAWGFDVSKFAKNATATDMFYLMADNYGGDLASLSSTETAGSSLADLGFDPSEYSVGIKTGDSADSITGIQKTGDYSLKVKLTKTDAAAIYQLGVAIAPLHYYGDKSKYDYDKNSFGFEKGDLSTVREKTTKPLGAGPYIFEKYEDGVVSFKANEKYYLGAPRTTAIQFREMNDDDKLNNLITGSVDITDPSYSTDTVDAIKKENSNNKVTGDKITTNTVDNLGYGYLGISAKAVNVGGEVGSEASKNLRKAFATVFAVYREKTVDSYYKDTASVINYPISNTSWAAPQATDPDYEIAFSKDVDGKDIYTSDMTEEQKEKAALDAALGFFKAAGYTVKDGKVTAAPKGAKMEYEAWIPADGSGDHPSFNMLTDASKALESIGIKLIVKDLANSADLWTGIEADQVPMWCAAWGATPDPDMYQVYYSGVGTKNEPGGSNYMYDIADKTLDENILKARESMDQAYRKQVYKNCLDIIVDWAVEVPVYQRQNAITFSTERVTLASVTPDITTYYGWLEEVQNIQLN